MTTPEPSIVFFSSGVKSVWTRVHSSSPLHEHIVLVESGGHLYKIGKVSRKIINMLMKQRPRR